MAVNQPALGLRGCKSLPAHMIKKIGSKYVIVAESGQKMGTYSTKKEAKKRLQQVEFFKHLQAGGMKGVKLRKKSLLKK